MLAYQLRHADGTLSHFQSLDDARAQAIDDQLTSRCGGPTVIAGPYELDVDGVIIGESPGFTTVPAVP